jgi:hypothetical protein
VLPWSAPQLVGQSTRDRMHVTGGPGACDWRVVPARGGRTDLPFGAVTSREHGAACEAIVHPTERLATRQEAGPAFVVTASPPVNPLAAAHAFLKMEAVQLSRVDDLVVGHRPKDDTGL